MRRITELDATVPMEASGLTPLSFASDSPGPISVMKHGVTPPLMSPIQRVFYLSYEGTAREHEVCTPQQISQSATVLSLFGTTLQGSSKL